MMLIKSPILLAAVSAALALSACNSGDPTKAGAPADNAGVQPEKTVVATREGVAATVNGIAIDETFVKLIAQQRGDLATPEARKKIIDNLAVQLLTSQEAIRKGLDKQPEISARIELNKQSLLATAFVQDYLKNNPVSEELVKAEYDRLKSQSHGIEYKARHIMVEKEADAKNIIAELKKNPKAFDAMARERSKDALTRQSGGDLGWFEPSGRDPELETAVANLAKGKFTEHPVRSQFGFHVILLEDSRPKQAPPMDQLQAQLKRQLEQEKLQKLLDDMKTKARIEV
jgi:peptidyl-prolyl cis-trans isomerase C